MLRQDWSGVDKPDGGTSPVICPRRFDGQSFDLSKRALVRRQDSPGANWAEGFDSWTLFYTFLPPNGPSCSGLNTSRRRHPGGVNTLFGGGSVTFTSEDIWAGNPATTMTDTP